MWGITHLVNVQGDPKDRDPPTPTPRMVPHKSLPFIRPPSLQRLRTFLPYHICRSPRWRVWDEKNCTLLQEGYPRLWTTFPRGHRDLGPFQSKDRDGLLSTFSERRSGWRRKSSVTSTVDACVLNAAWNSLKRSAHGYERCEDDSAERRNRVQDRGLWIETVGL